MLSHVDAVLHSQPALNQFSPPASIGCDDGPDRVVVPSNSLSPCWTAHPHQPPMSLCRTARP